MRVDWWLSSGNECLVHYFKDKIPIYGIHPGMASVNQVLSSEVIPPSILKKVIPVHRIFTEVTQSSHTHPTTYGHHLTSLMLSPSFPPTHQGTTSGGTCEDGAGRSGMLLNHRLQEVLPSDILSDNNCKVFIERSQGLAERALGRDYFGS